MSIATFATALNLDQRSRHAAQSLWDRTKVNLPEESAVWLACCVYVAGNNLDSPPTPGDNEPRVGMYLKPLLAAVQLDPLVFFEYLADFANRLDCNDPVWQRIRHHASHMLFSLQVTSLLRKKFGTIMASLNDSHSAPSVASPLRQTSRDPSSPSTLLRGLAESASKREKIELFTWTLFLAMKNEMPGLAVDLVLSFALLTCCVAFVHTNARHDPAFRCPALEINGTCPEEWLLSTLHRRFGGAVDALPHAGDGTAPPALNLTDIAMVHERVFLPNLRKLVSQGVLNLLEGNMGAFDYHGEADDRRHVMAHALRDPRLPLDWHLRAVTCAYETRLQLSGLVDERLLAGLGAMPGTPARAPATPMPHSPMGARKAPVVASTPGTPVSMAHQTIWRLQQLVPDGNDPGGVPLSFQRQILALLPSLDAHSWQPRLVESVLQWRSQAEVALASGSSDLRALVARQRASLAAQLYFQLLETIVVHEHKTVPGFVRGLTGLLSASQFHHSLFSCALEIVLHAHQLKDVAFPWVLSALSLSAFEFQKIVEVVVRTDHSLPPSTVTHLRRCEDATLMSLVWRLGTPLLGLLGAGAPQPVTGPVALVFRKLSALAAARLGDLSRRLAVPAHLSAHMLACLHHAVRTEHPRLLWGRHIDLLVLCSMVGVSRAMRTSDCGKDLTFRDILIEYRTMTQADPSLCFRIPLGSPETLGDVVAYYNTVFLSVMAPLLHKLAGKMSLVAPDTAPLPAFAPSARGGGGGGGGHAAPRGPRLVGRPGVLVPFSPLGTNAQLVKTPSGAASYSFQVSPVKALQAINQPQPSKNNPPPPRILGLAAPALMQETTALQPQPPAFLRRLPSESAEPDAKRVRGLTRRISGNA